MKYVIVIPLYRELKFRAIGKFDSENDAHNYVDSYFGLEINYSVQAYNKDLHEDILEDATEETAYVTR